MEASYESESESESEAGPGTQRPGTGTVSAAVREHLRKLCLREFPCGAGSWKIPPLPLQNKSRFLPQTWRTWRELVPREEDVVSPGEETVEALLGLVRSRHSPWALLNNSNAEDSFLRELAIRNPLTITDTFFYSYFRSLRVIDKKVTLVDKDLLKFLKLEELVLSANRIKEVDATNLPPTLKVLELYGNEISSMECLCAHPPAGLQHLGLGHNKLLGPLESLYVTANHWGRVRLGLGDAVLTAAACVFLLFSEPRSICFLVCGSRKVTLPLPCVLVWPQALARALCRPLPGPFPPGVPPQSGFEKPSPASRPPSPPASGSLLPLPSINPTPALSTPALSTTPPRWLSPAVPSSLPVLFVQSLLDARSARGSVEATERFGQEERSPVKGGRWGRLCDSNCEGGSATESGDEEPGTRSRPGVNLGQG
ncbi:leucine-rich repeat-containing protein 43 isoform X10 [Homo sapiens]|uniref:leucine-rich repeat-containing protein 43 isoform X10 n=1 Tax=Homo sapiens TaxID=9606 RepID=UPI0007DC4F04|nr:leucine-rich repeat-containing protein 43 isoform X10 [Homo sapiens]|eukprot:XP_016874614.1 leucine-rich repeat-containing protein 43 isoform X2 [Homo sapiens]